MASTTKTALRNGFVQAVAAMLDVRLLFSCLVDTDFLDTEAHFNGDAKGKRPSPGRTNARPPSRARRTQSLHD
jgi:hypothetical protein